MFVQHKQLKVLNIPAGKIARLNTSAYNVQMAFPGYPPQLGAAFLIAVSGGSKVLIIVGFFLSESKQSIFFVPQQGEVPVEEAEAVFDEGFVFTESMGFVLSETDFHLLSNDDQRKLWQSLPICRALDEISAAEPMAQFAANESAENNENDLEHYRKRSLESLGRFLSSM
jgi:hypothetical protein